jgi:hypothetical protein
MTERSKGAKNEKRSDQDKDSVVQGKRNAKNAFKCKSSAGTRSNSPVAWAVEDKGSTNQTSTSNPSDAAATIKKKALGEMPPKLAEEPSLDELPLTYLSSFHNITFL